MKITAPRVSFFFYFKEGDVRVNVTRTPFFSLDQFYTTNNADLTLCVAKLKVSTVY